MRSLLRDLARHALLTWRAFNDLAESLPRRMDDWVHAYREQEGMEPDPGVEQRRAKRQS